MRTIYGTGIIQSIRNDGTHVVTVQSWKLANNTSPTLYLQADSLIKEVTSECIDLLKGYRLEIMVEKSVI